MALFIYCSRHVELVKKDLDDLLGSFPQALQDDWLEGVLFTPSDLLTDVLETPTKEVLPRVQTPGQCDSPVVSAIQRLAALSSPLPSPIPSLHGTIPSMVCTVSYEVLHKICNYRAQLSLAGTKSCTILSVLIVFFFLDWISLTCNTVPWAVDPSAALPSATRYTAATGDTSFLLLPGEPDQQGTPFRCPAKPHRTRSSPGRRLSSPTWPKPVHSSPRRRQFHQLLEVIQGQAMPPQTASCGAFPPPTGWGPHQECQHYQTASYSPLITALLLPFMFCWICYIYQYLYCYIDLTNKFIFEISITYGHIILE